MSEPCDFVSEPCDFVRSGVAAPHDDRLWRRLRADGRELVVRSRPDGERLPERFVPRTRNATLTLAGRNLWKSTKYNGLDPELRDASDAGSTLSRREYYQIPPARQFLASIRVTF